MTAFLLTWKEVILFAALCIVLFIPRCRGVRKYLLLGLFIYLANKPLIADFHPGNIMWWLKGPASWITVATWVGAAVIVFRWLKDIHGQGVWNVLMEVRWQHHLVTFSLIVSTIFLFNLSAISPQFKTQADFSFVVVLINIPLQYLIGSFLLRTHDGAIQFHLLLALIGVLLCVLYLSLTPLYRTIIGYRALLNLSPSRGRPVKLIGQWETLLEINEVPSFGSVRMTAYGRIGDLKLSLGDRNGARQWYKKALREDPYDVTASRGLARLLVREGETKEAQETLQRAIRPNPSLSWEQLTNAFPPLRAHELFVIATVLEAEGREDEAFHVYSQALKLNPHNPWANFRLGKIYFSRGDYDNARPALQKTITKLPRHLYALSYLIDIYETEGTMDLAQKYRDIILQEVVTHRIQRSQWQGRAGGNLYGNYGCHARVKLYKGRLRFQIQARGTPAQGVWPHMVVKLGNEIIGEADVTSREWKPYSFTQDVQTGAYLLLVYFTNDFRLQQEVDNKKIGEDRNLFVGDVKISYVR